MTTSHRSSVMFSTGCQSHSASSKALSTRFSITSRSCSRVPVRLLPCDSFHRIWATAMINLEDRSPCAKDENALWRSCFLCRRSSMLEQSPSCLADSVDSFKVQLKTYLFAKAYPIQLLVRRPCSGMATLLRHINCHNYYYQVQVQLFLFGIVYYYPLIHSSSLPSDLHVLLTRDSANNFQATQLCLRTALDDYPRSWPVLKTTQ